MVANEATLLVCTVGGSPEPIITSIRHLNPQRICFIPSEDTKHLIDQVIAPQTGIQTGAYRCYSITDSQDLRECLELIQKTSEEVEEWVSRGPTYRVIVDFTGGTKSMSAALAIVAGQWRNCSFSYVGGSSRTKGGIGVVESGSEEVIIVPYPLQLRRLYAMDQFRLFFNQGAFAAAKQIAEDFKKTAEQQDVKRQFNALEHLAKVFYQWDRFAHSDALSTLDDLPGNDLRAALTERAADDLVRETKRLRPTLEGLISSNNRPSKELIIDLLANARRRASEELYDDAVARLYRAIEALGQSRLPDYGIERSDKVPLERVPTVLRERWVYRAENGVLKLGLQDVYALLEALDDPLGRKFRELKLDGDTSQLVIRNTSILAHGFAPVTKAGFDQLWKVALDLADLVGIRETELPSFPKLFAP
jgi:CRISPR-associated protein (TIGR02710 family)